ncbi:hypothetical protein [Streptomyces sp. MS191]|nr:hypothetical protein [Streptomyces sp. ms191]
MAEQDLTAADREAQAALVRAQEAQQAAEQAKYQADCLIAARR